MKKLVIAGGAAMALGLAGIITAGAAWYFFIRENAELASDPPEIPAALLNATASPTSPASTTGLTGTTAPAPSATVAYQSQIGSLRGGLLRRRRASVRWHPFDRQRSDKGRQRVALPDRRWDGVGC